MAKLLLFIVCHFQQFSVLNFNFKYSNSCANSRAVVKINEVQPIYSCSSCCPITCRCNVRYDFRVKVMFGSSILSFDFIHVICIYLRMLVFNMMFVSYYCCVF